MKLAIIGCGNMGLTYAKSLLRDKLVEKKNLYLIEKIDTYRNTLTDLGVLSGKINEQISNYDGIILAVKPQDAKPTYEELKKYIKPNQLLLSIMAGIPISVLQTNLNHKNIVRAMPNTPAQIGKGITGFTASAEVSDSAKTMAEQILAATGKTVYLKDEAMLDAVTAISGSGPAYYYYFVNAMINAGTAMGLDEKTAALLVKETMNGSYHLMKNSDKSLLELIAAVKSKGGTTEAALNVLESKKVDESIQIALQAAENRAKELSKI